MSGFVITSDWHLDWVTRGRPRAAEIVGAIREAVEYARRKEAAFVFAGDLCDPEDGDVVATGSAQAIRFASELARHGCSSVWVAGNHDVVEAGAQPVTTLTPLHAMGASGYLSEISANAAQVVVMEKPGVAFFGDVAVVGLPHTAHGLRVDADAAAREALRSTAGSRAVLVVAHLTVPGIVPGEEVTEMARGRELVLPVRAILDHQARHPEQCVVVVNGHYHRRMRHEVEGLVVHVPGSLARLTFAEEDHTPGFIYLEFKEI